MRTQPFLRVLAVALAIAVPAVLNPAWAADSSAGLSGRILAGDARTPVSGAFVELTGPSDRVIRSEASHTDGTFTLTGLVPGTYRCVISTEDGLYQVSSSLTFDPGQARTIQIALKQDDALAAGVVSARGGAGGGEGEGVTAGQKALIGMGIILGTVALSDAISSDNKKKKKASASSPSN